MAPNNTLSIWGNEKTMNLNTLILTNIQSSPYFKVNLYEKKTYHEVIDEIFYKVSHLEPWEKGSRKTAGQTGMCGGVRGVGAGGIVSSAYCLLYKLFTLRLTRKQLGGLLDHADSPYIRGLGFMYIRYCQDPKDMWEWYEPYLDDDEEIDVKAGGGHIMTIGEMLRQWLVKLEWYATLFPRIPVPVQKDIDIKMRERNMQWFEAPQEEVQPRHIADDELNFGEAERYAVTAATRARSPTPPYKSRPRTPPPRHRSPPPRPRVSPSRHRPHHISPTRQRQRSPPRPRSPHRQRSPRPRDGEPAMRSRDGEPVSRNRDGEPGYRTREGELPLRTRDGEPGYRTRDGEPGMRARDGEPANRLRDGEPMDFTRELQREKERQGRQPSEDRTHQDDDEDDDDDPIEFAKKLLLAKQQQQGTALTFREKLEQRAKSMEAQKLNNTEKQHKHARSKDKNESVTDSKEKSRKNDSVTDSKDSKEKSRKNDNVTDSNEKVRKRSRSKEKEEKSSHEKSKHQKKSKKHHRDRSKEREKKKHKSKHRSRSKSVDRNGNQP